MDNRPRMTLRNHLCAALLLLLSACADSGGERAPTGATRQAVVGGTTAKNDPAVVMSLQRPSASSDQVSFICTGAIVSPHVGA